MNRRMFLRNLALGACGIGLAPRLLAEEQKEEIIPEKDALRMAFVGVGGMGGWDTHCFHKFQKQKVAAVCDVNKNTLKHAGELYGAPTFTDYREMFDKMAGKIDAVLIAIPDVSHFGAAMCAAKHKVPMYLEKPMCHTIWQVRELYKTVKKNNVIAQMGNQSHSTEGIRYCKEWIEAGLIGNVREVILWTDRPLGQGVASFPNNVSEYPPSATPPDFIDWNLWQNVAEPQEYFEDGLVFGRWRGWWKYGSGSLGDIGCHMLDIPVYALGLGYPDMVKSHTRGATKISVPSQERVDYYFKKSKQGVPVKVSWYSGFKFPAKDGSYPEGYDTSLLPPLPKEWTKLGRTHRDISDNGQFIIGDKGVIYCNNMHMGGRPALLPRDLWLSVKDNLPRTEPRIFNNDHHRNFIQAVRGEASLSSPFDYAHVLTEIVQLGNLASRTQSDIVWDAKRLVCKNNPAATKLVNTPMRKGWY